MKILVFVGNLARFNLNSWKILKTDEIYWKAKFLENLIKVLFLMVWTSDSEATDILKISNKATFSNISQI